MWYLGKLKQFRRGQMFILATMLIAVYIVTMAAALMSIGSQQIEIDREAIKEPYLNSKNELQSFLELLLADYSKNESSLTSNEASNRINNFISEMRIINSERGVISEFIFNKNNFIIIANKFPYNNITSSSVYTSQIYAEFDLTMSTIDSSITIEESFSISFIGHAEVIKNSIIIQQSEGIEYENINAASIYILNGSSSVIPSLDPSHTGIYIFEGLSDLNNIGVLNITLFNGVSIYS
jgi:hypothetical protein